MEEKRETNAPKINSVFSNESIKIKIEDNKMLEFPLKKEEPVIMSDYYYEDCEMEEVNCETVEVKYVPHLEDPLHVDRKGFFDSDYVKTELKSADNKEEIRMDISDVSVKSKAQLKVKGAEPTSSKVTHKILNLQSRKIVNNVATFMKEEATAGNLIIPLRKVQKRTAKATGVSLNTVVGILKGQTGKVEEEPSLLATALTKNKPHLKLEIDDFDQCALRRLIHNLYLTEKIVPTLERIHTKFQETVGYNRSKQNLRKILRNIGFYWHKPKTRTLLMERHDIRDLRLQYLRRIKQFRQEERPIVYMDVTHIHSSHSHEKSCSDNGAEAVLKSSLKSQRLIILHAGGEMGFVSNALSTFRSQTTTGDYRSDISIQNYKEWLTEKLIPNLPESSIVVIDNAPYHNVQIDKVPTATSPIDDMRQWLSDRNVPFTSNMLKPDLYNLIKLHKPRYKMYEIDLLFRKKNHTILRLPPYHPDLNPIELVWSSLRQYVADKNLAFTVEEVERLCMEFFAMFTVDEWVSCCHQIRKFEDEYMQHEPEIDHVMDEIIVNPGAHSESDSTSDDDSCNDDEGNND